MKHCLQDDESGTRPLYRPSDWQVEVRQANKKKKRHSWSAKGGYVAPIFVPPTPDGELARLLREIADKETDAGVKFKVVETGGHSMKSQVQLSNPTATAGCELADCMPCSTGTGGASRCRRSNILYEFECQLCPPGNKSKYIGESSRNLYTRAKEHSSNYTKKTPKSFMQKHQTRRHRGEPGSYAARVTGSYTDCLSRQVSEGVRIRRCNVEVLNSKTEWHQPPLWRVQNEIYRG